MDLRQFQDIAITGPRIRKALVHWYDNEPGILAIEERGYSIMSQHVANDKFDLVVAVPMRCAGTDIAVVAEAASEPYVPFSGRTSLGKPERHAVRVDVKNVRYTTWDRVRKAFETAGMGWGAPWTGNLVDLDETLLADLERGLAVSNVEHVGEGPTYPGEVANLRECPERSVRQVLVNAYERSPAARRRCIEHFGPKCAICRFDFGRVFGNAADGFIHVHHLKPLSEIGEDYQLDPILDLLPVCPNCHSVLHMRSPAYSIDEVRRMRRRHEMRESER